MTGQRLESVFESTTASIDASDDEATALVALGQSLAATTGWGKDSDDSPDASVLDVQREIGSGKVRLRVRDAIGALSVPGLQIEVHPKIPLPHFAWIAASARPDFRLNEREQLALQLAPTFQELLCSWFITRTESVLAAGLSSDYREVEAPTAAVRGRISLAPTLQAFYRGSPSTTARFDVFDEDTALNRLLRGAAHAALRMTHDDALRARARRVARQLGHVSEHTSADMHATPERRTGHYSEAVSLAKWILRSGGRSLRGGSESSWAFLVPTPSLIEKGLLGIIRREVPEYEPRPRSISLQGLRAGINPDIVFGGENPCALADVKYKLWDDSWARADLYEVVAFAAGLGVEQAALISFSPSSAQPKQTSHFGDIRVADLVWRTGDGTEPVIAEKDFIRDLQHWLLPCSPRLSSEGRPSQLLLT